MSKGSAVRPRQVSREEYERRWARVFPRTALGRAELRVAAEAAVRMDAELERNFTAPQADGDDGSWLGHP